MQCEEEQEDRKEETEGMDTENKLKIMHNSLRLRISGASREEE